ncbi:cytochrome P450 [Apiospora saccharicola]|uniref:Cytochrome P450 n=1 Tax=Apiospora saccharicola TaxID=335842 RepID=A0ABR1W4Z9_9PEZI
MRLRSVSNVVPSSATLAIYILSDKALVSSLQSSLSSLSPDLLPKELESIPLLVSAYAEALRFGVHIHVPRNAPHHDVRVQGVTIPKDKLLFVNTYLAHNDEAVWNTRNGEKPLNRFCADRFLTDPSDPSSGPAKKMKQAAASGKAKGGVQFSTEGLDGAWIPFGDRLLAKRIMPFTAALLLRYFDMELLVDGGKPSFHSPRFGLSVAMPTAPVPFRLRRRNHVCGPESTHFERGD